MTTVDKQVHALNNLIAGINLAQGRGSYSLAESAKLHEAVTILVDSLNNPASVPQPIPSDPANKKEQLEK